MTRAQYEKVAGELVAEANRIETSKRPGYTGGDLDVLKNFKAVAQRAGISPEQAWTVYFLKHIDAILSIMNQPNLPVSEAPIGRFADALNYLKLGWAILQERTAQQAAYIKYDPTDPKALPRAQSMQDEWRLKQLQDAINQKQYVPIAQKDPFGPGKLAPQIGKPLWQVFREEGL